MMHSFNFHLPTKIVFGQPALEILPVELSALKVQSALIVSDQGLADLGLVSQFESILQSRDIRAVPFTSVTSNPTSDEVELGTAVAHEANVEAIVALGGGSPIDVAKGIALLLANGGSYTDYLWAGKAITQRSWPLIAIPTTAGTGSEVSKVAVVSDIDIPFKKGVLSPLMYPHVAVVDPDLTVGLPPALTAATGIDTFVHAFEAYVGIRTNPFSDQLALAGLRSVWNYLPRATKRGDDMEARQEMMLAALWGGIAMDQAGLGLVHALSGPLSSHFHLHHGLANAIILPHVVRFNLSAVPIARRRNLNKVFGLKASAGEEALVEVLIGFLSELGLPSSLDEVDVSFAIGELDIVAEETTRMVLIKNNPRPANQGDCRKLLEEMA